MASPRNVSPGRITCVQFAVAMVKRPFKHKVLTLFKDHLNDFWTTQAEF